MEEHRQPGHLDVEGEASNQPVRSIIDPGLPPRNWLQWDPRWALMGTATALLLMALIVLGFADTTVPSSSVNLHTTAFSPGFLAPSIQRRPLTMHRPKLVTLSSSSTAVEARTRFAPQMYQDGIPGDQRGLPTLTKEDEEKGYLAAQAAGDFPDFPPSIGHNSPTKEDTAAVEAVTMFAMMDLDGNGVVSEAEFRTYLARFSYTESASTRIFKALDANGDGEICVDEVRELASFADGNSNSALGKNRKFGDAVLVEARRSESDRMYDTIDDNGDGEISSAELRTYLMGNGYTEIASDAVLRSLDSNDDGKLCRSELSDGFEKYSKMRQAVMELVKNLVVSGRWASSADEQVAIRAKKAELVS